MSPLCSRQARRHRSEKDDESGDLGACKAAAESSAGQGWLEQRPGRLDDERQREALGETSTTSAYAGDACTCYLCPDTDVRFGTMKWCDCGGPGGASAPPPSVARPRFGRARDDSAAGRRSAIPASAGSLGRAGRH